MTEIQNSKLTPPQDSFGRLTGFTIGISDVEIVSDFELGISDFPSFCRQQAQC
jgi:hypothetical protein